LIKIGQTLDECDFSLITNFFIKNKCDEVESVLKEFPKRSNLLDNANNNSFNTINLSTAIESKGSRPLDDYPSKNMQVLIINQQSFYRETNPELIQMLPDHDLSERKGTDRDRDALKLLFEDFGYQVSVANNLKHLDILKEIEKATRKASLVSGLIVCILSHGFEGIVYGTNSIPVRIKDIKKIMATKILLGKSKIFLVQACQGENLQQSVKKVTSKTEFDGPAQSTIISGSVFADFLTFWSTIEGFASVRHIDNGSWFIQELVRKVREHHRDQHLMDICTNVIKEVSLKRGYRDECMLPKLETTFTRNFRFPKTENHSNC
jgi:caspase 8